jgi:hypothetical protein
MLQEQAPSIAGGQSASGGGAKASIPEESEEGDAGQAGANTGSGSGSSRCVMYKISLAWSLI